MSVAIGSMKGNHRMSSSRLAALAFAAAITLPSLGAAQAPAPPTPPRGPEGVAFYELDPSTLPPEGKPGDVIWWRPLTGVAALKAAGSNELVLYRSAATDEKQTPITVSGIIALPPGSPPEGGWPVISWAHGTVGVADKCAPSRDDEESLAHGINKAPHPLLNAYLRQGWAVVMTDYEGLGTPRPHPFLLGHSEARGILDIVRAAHKLHPGKLSKRFAIVGHSQGGQAALFAAADAKGWAPELELRTVIAFAPASQIKPLFWLGASGKEPSMGSAFIPLFLTGAIAGNPNIAYGKLLPTPDVLDMLRTLKELQQRYASLGITTVEDGLATKSGVVLLQLAAALRVLFLDVLVFPKWTEADAIYALPLLPKRAYVHHLKVGGVKVTQDGSPQGKTAYLSAPYLKPPPGQPADYRGQPILSQEELDAEVETAFTKGRQLHCHCNGDAAADMLLDSLERATAKLGMADRRPVMVHAQTVREDQLKRMKALGVIPTFFVAHTFYWGDWHRDETLGPDRAERISPLRSAANQDLRYTIHNDSPVVPPDILPLLWSAVARTTRSGKVLGEEQRVTPLEALKAVTAWAAYQNFEEGQKGTLERGKLADLVVLSDNPLTVPSEALRNLYVLETVKSGRTVYQRPPEASALAGSLRASTTVDGPMVLPLPRHTCC
jgi:pimeloyl-ACP methyl ester carboxylesterase